MARGVDFITNGKGHGDVANRLLKSNGDWGVLRPFEYEDQSYITVNDGVDLDGNAKFKTITTNAPSLLRYDEWKLIDKTVDETVRDELDFVADLRSRGLERVIGNAFAHSVLQYNVKSKGGNASLHMSPLVRTDRDRLLHDTKGLPLPIAHSDGNFDIRDIAMSRNMGRGIDVDMIRESTSEVLELIEDMHIGVGDFTGYTYAGYSIPGAINFAERHTKTITAPTTPGWTPEDFLEELLAARQMVIDDKRKGPFVLYHNSQWDPWLDIDWSAAKGDITFRERILKLTDIREIRRLDRLPATNWRMILLDMNKRTVQTVIGMEVRTIQWATSGDLEWWYKVMAMILPLFKADYEGKSGVVDMASA